MDNHIKRATDLLRSETFSLGSARSALDMINSGHLSAAQLAMEDMRTANLHRDLFAEATQARHAMEQWRRDAEVHGGLHSMVSTAQRFIEDFRRNEDLRRMITGTQYGADLVSAQQMHRTMLENVNQAEIATASIRFAKDIADMVAMSRSSADQIAALMGPMSALRASGMLDELKPHMLAASSMREMLFAREQHFIVPAHDYARSLLSDDVRTRSMMAGLSIDDAMVRMHSPWLDTTRPSTSVSAFAELLGLGNALLFHHPFDVAVSSLVRTSLGDWRDGLTSSDVSFDDIAARTTLYGDRGLNEDLTDFPAPAFQESLEIAEINTPVSGLLAMFGPPVPRLDSAGEVALSYTGEARDEITRFEIFIRQFMNDQLTSAFGKNWVLVKFKQHHYPRWLDKQEKDVRAGRAPQAIIDYIDFAEYADIITRDDIWPLFQPYFQRKEDVRESFARLIPARNPAAHSRFLTHADLLIIFYEIKRIVDACTRDLD